MLYKFCLTIFVSLILLAGCGEELKIIEPVLIPDSDEPIDEPIIDEPIIDAPIIPIENPTTDDSIHHLNPVGIYATFEHERRRDINEITNKLKKRLPVFKTGLEAWEHENVQLFFNDYFQLYFDQEVHASACGRRQLSSWAKSTSIEFENPSARTEFLELASDVEGGLSENLVSTRGTTRYTYTEQYQKRRFFLLLHIDNIYVHDVDIPNHCE